MNKEILEQIKLSPSYRALTEAEQVMFLSTLENAPEENLKEIVDEIQDNDYLASLNEKELIEEVKKRESELRISDAKLSRAQLKMSEEVDREGEKSIFDDIDSKLGKIK